MVMQTEVMGSSWSPAATRDRTQDGRPVFVLGDRRYVEVPLGGEDAYRFLRELRLEMSGADFRAFVERHRAEISAAVLWRLGLGPIPLAPEEPVVVERARAQLKNLFKAA
ncbi:MAG: hypothetical protein AUH31_01265 [Armatimonadetes bacterium 13_1_40CM_64_14]|nr:MAG: hypothetical protein AUH31_01265 [Armatimonadetes bacterium 13_1_40CM_64_14]